MEAVALCLRGRGYDDVKDVWCKSFLIIPASTGVKGKAAREPAALLFLFQQSGANQLAQFLVNVRAATLR
jgi:hypothetical protein